MKLINHRFRVIETIKSDIYGEIFLVEDLKRMMTCYLRLFTVEMSQTHLIEFFKINYVHYSTLNHPNLYSNYKFDIIDTVDNKMHNRKQFFYTYEAEIESKIDYLELNRQEAIQVILEICAALRYLHFRGVVYKYLTFDNIQIYRTDDSQLKVKLTDLATLQLMKDEVRTEKNYNQFIAPEIFWKEVHNSQADIYSLGIVFYFLYHRSPYKNKTADESLRKNIKNSVDKVVAQMIRISIVDEITSINEFLSILQRMFNLQIDFSDYDYFNKLQLKAPILERFEERSFFVKTVQDKFNRNSDHNAALIVGDMGTGKTRILDEAETILRWEDYRVIRINCDTFSEGDYPVFKLVLEEIIEYGDLSQELIMKYGSDLVKLIPEAISKWGVQPDESLDENIEQLRIKNRLFNFLREYSTIQKIVIIFDAIQYLNIHEIELLDYLMSDNKENQYFIIAAFENDNLESTHMNEWEKNKRVIVKTLVNFNYDQASNFVSSILGVGYNPIELTAKVMRDAQGNLKLIKDIVKNLFAKGFIYVNERNEWVLDEHYDELESTNLLKVRSDFMKNVDTILKDSMPILELLALFKNSAPLDCISALISDSTKDIKRTLNDLTIKNIVKMKFDDLGETYDFCSRSLKRSIEDDIDKQKKESLNVAIAEFYEARLNQDGYQYMELIIHHFSNGNHKQKAIEYCNKLAKHMEKSGMFLQAIELYNRALGILHTQKKIALIGRNYFSIGKIYKLIGESELSRAFAVRGLEIAYEFDDSTTIVDCLILLSHHYSKRRDVIRTRQYIAEAKEYTKDLNEIYLHRVHLVELSLLIAEGNLNQAREILQVTKTSDAVHVLGVCMNYEGVISLKEGELGEALKYFNQSIEYFKQSEYIDPIVKLEPINNIGQLYCNYLDEIEKGRGYYLEAIKRADQSNLSRATAVFVRNLGETYLMEDKPEKAVEAFTSALQIVEKTMDSFIRADICRLLCLLHLKTENYQKSSFYLRKLESEYDDINNNSFVNVDYYLVHIKFYLHIKDYDLASQWCKRLRNSDLILEEKQEFVLRVLEYEVEVFRKQYFNYTVNIDLRFVEVLVKTQSNLAEAKIVRQLILRLTTNLMNYKKYIDVHYLLKLDHLLKDVFDTEFMKMKHDILKGILKDNRIDYFNMLIAEKSKEIAGEDKWLIYKVLGDEYYDHYNYYEAILCYFNAFDILKDLAETLPKEFKENYIFCDEVKLDLKSKINNIHRKLVGHSYKEKTVYTELEIRKADDFFDLSDFKNFVQNKSIQNSINSIYKVKHGSVLSSVSDLIKNFGKNEIKNIKLILQYSTQILMGDRGFIFILDEGNKVREIIKSQEDAEVPDIERLLKSSINMHEGLLLNSIYDNIRSNPYLENQKGLLFIPIIKSVASSSKRRMNDFEENNIEVKGYMYIDAKEAFNNFTREAYEECLSLLSMLYFFVDNYNLKKVSTIDKLTDVYLRSYFEDMFSRSLHKAKTKGESLAVVMLDIDKFKNINDTYGHRKGDEILSRMCQVIKSSIRDTDLIGRYGGEEFILIFPKTNKENAYIICEKIRNAIMNTNFLKDEKSVTISLGISTFPELGLVEDELIEKADQALYHSKNTGRNRTTIWTTDLGENQLRFDKLAGILEGNISTDTRNVQALVDIMNAVKTDQDKKHKIENVLKTITDVCEAQKISLIELNQGEIVNVSTKFTGLNEINNQMIVEENIIKEFSQLSNAEHFINWNDISELSDKNIPDWKSLIVAPLNYKSVNKGVLIVSVPIATKEFGFNTTNFVNAVSGVIATIL